MKRLHVTLRHDDGTFVADLEPDDAVVVFREGRFVGQGWWETDEIVIWDWLLGDDVRTQLGQKLLQAIRAR